MGKKKSAPPMFSIVIDRHTTEEYLKPFTVPELRRALKEYTGWQVTSAWGKQKIIDKLLLRADAIKTAYKISEDMHTIEKQNDHGRSKYNKRIMSSSSGGSCIVDVYSVLAAFNITNPALQHAIKKLLMPGLRGKNNTADDLEEVIVAINRAIQIEGKKNEQTK